MLIKVILGVVYKLLIASVMFGPEVQLVVPETKDVADYIYLITSHNYLQ